MNAVIIDFDGTLADSFDFVLDFLLTQAGRDTASMPVSERQKLKGLSMMNLAIAVGISRWRLPIIYFRGKARLTKHMDATPIFDGMEGVLASLKADNFKLYIMSSNSRRNITRFLVTHGLSGYFIKVYGNSGWFTKGPAMRRVLKRNKLDNNETVYVGDEVRDIVGAQLAGMPSIAVSWGFGSEEELLKYNPTVLVRKPAELQKTLIEWGRS